MSSKTLMKSKFREEKNIKYFKKKYSRRIELFNYFADLKKLKKYFI